MASIKMSETIGHRDRSTGEIQIPHEYVALLIQGPEGEPQTAYINDHGVLLRCTERLEEILLVLERFPQDRALYTDWFGNPNLSRLRRALIDQTNIVRDQAADWFLSTGKARSQEQARLLVPRELFGPSEDLLQEVSALAFQCSESEKPDKLQVFVAQTRELIGRLESQEDQPEMPEE